MQNVIPRRKFFRKIKIKSITKKLLPFPKIHKIKTNQKLKIKHSNVFSNIVVSLSKALTSTLILNPNITPITKQIIKNIIINFVSELIFIFFKIFKQTPIQIIFYR